MWNKGVPKSKFLIYLGLSLTFVPNILFADSAEWFPIDFVNSKTVVKKPLAVSDNQATLHNDGFLEHTSNHYNIRGQFSSDRLSSVANTLEGSLKYLYPTVLPGGFSSNELLNVVLFSTKEKYENHVLRASNNYSTRKDVPTFIYFHKSKNRPEHIAGWNSRKYLIRSMKHEGWHQYAAMHVNNMPIWLNEGVAELFEDAKLDSFSKTKTIGVHIHQGWVLRDKIYKYDPKNMVFRSNAPTQSIEQLISMDYEEFHNNNEGLNYAHAWGLVFFLHQRSGKEGRKKLKNILRNMKKRASHVNNSLIARQLLYRNTTPEKFQKEFDEFVRGLIYVALHPAMVDYVRGRCIGRGRGSVESGILKDAMNKSFNQIYKEDNYENLSPEERKAQHEYDKERLSEILRKNLIQELKIQNKKIFDKRGYSN